VPYKDEKKIVLWERLSSRDSHLREILFAAGKPLPPLKE
jgi:hypothetical protein